MDYKPTILIADDESHIVHVLSLKLSATGYEVISATDGEEALELAVERRPDLLITDYQMPCMSGLDLCLSLRREPTTHDIPVLMLTARGFSLSQEQIDRANIQAVLSKPFSPRDVVAQVRSILSEVWERTQPVEVK